MIGGISEIATIKKKGEGVRKRSEEDEWAKEERTHIQDISQDSSRVEKQKTLLFVCLREKESERERETVPFFWDEFMSVQKRINAKAKRGFLSNQQAI
ncbi:MAG: hypothetical protein Q8P67_08365 [archaeon]|nr:hypothetical protein [archaeon]